MCLDREGVLEIDKKNKPHDPLLLRENKAILGDRVLSVENPG